MIPDNRYERHHDAAREHLGRGVDVRLHDDDDRRRGTGRRIVGELADTACDENPDVGLATGAVAETGSAHRLPEPRVDLRVGKRDVERQHARGVPQPAHVALEEERLPVVGPQRLVDAFAVEKPMIEHRDDGVLPVGHAAVHVHPCCHERSVLGVLFSRNIADAL